MSRRALALLLLCGCGGVLRAESPVTVRLAIYENPPHTLIENGQPAGFIVDVVRDFCRENGYTLAFVPGTFSEALERLQSGQVDLVAPIAFTEERRQKFLYSRESIVIDWSNVILPPGSQVKDLSDLQNGRIGGVRSDLFFFKLKDDLGQQGAQARFVDYPDLHDLVSAVSNQTIDAGFIGHFTLMSLLKAEGSRLKVRLMPGSLYHEPLFFAVSRTRPDLLLKLDPFIDQAKNRPDHPISHAREKWFAEAANPSILRFLADYYLQIAGGITLLLGTILTFNLILRRKVRTSVQEVARQKSFFQNLFQNIPVGIILLDKQGRIVEMNREFHQMFGFSFAEIAESTLDERIAAPDALSDARMLTQRARQGERVFAEGRRRTRDGHLLDVQIIASPITIEGEVVASLGIYLDVTERKRLEEQLIKIRNIESIGVLAGGIAHDFNNMLTGILGNISLARARSSDPTLQKTLENAEKASLKAKGLTQQLLTFSKGGAPRKKVASVAEILKDALDLILSGSGIRREMAVAADLPPVEVDITQITQVFHNILLNAKEAMGESGHLRVSVRPHDQVETDSKLTSGRYVQIDFTDDGPGISEQGMSRLFIPYHTTKKGGSGLGLAISYSIIRKHNGHLKAHSSPGEGSTFTVFLPASDKVIQADEKAVINPDKEARLLLMDDDEMICEVFGEMLSGTRLHLDVVRNSGEAEAAFRSARERGQPHHLIFLDLTIPGDIGGIKTLELLRAVDPAIRAVAISGYSASEVYTDPGKFHFQDFLPKPFGLEDLLLVLNRNLS